MNKHCDFMASKEGGPCDLPGSAPTSNTGESHIANTALLVRKLPSLEPLKNGRWNMRAN
eukprot:IDg9272t1